MGRPTGGQRALARWDAEHDDICGERGLDEVIERRLSAGWELLWVLSIGRLSRILWCRARPSVPVHKTDS
jgi:hypothetical protein